MVPYPYGLGGSGCGGIYFRRIASPYPVAQNSSLGIGEKPIFGCQFDLPNFPKHRDDSTMTSIPDHPLGSPQGHSKKEVMK